MLCTLVVVANVSEEYITFTFKVEGNFEDEGSKFL
jgi:hypothetical protein